LSKSPCSKRGDAEIDEAVETWARLDTFFRATSLQDPKTTFANDVLCIKPTLLTGPEQTENPAGRGRGPSWAHLGYSTQAWTKTLHKAAAEKTANFCQYAPH
ncbi:MAG: hypothetical protein AAGF22_07280, partial [Pseudomonadota bacterium]